MTIILDQGSLTVEYSAVKLARYAKLIGYPETLFFGINDSRIDASSRATCREIWTKPERDEVAKYLYTAQEEIENIIGYPLNRRWFADSKKMFRTAILAKMGKIVSGGIMAKTLISSGVALSHASDPAVNAAPVSVSVTDTDEIKICHPGTDVEIFPSSMTIASGELDFEIPRARLVKAAYQDNPETGLSYDDVSVSGPFLQSVDIYRVYNDPSTNAVFRWPNSSACDTASCVDTTQTGCIYIINGDLGIVRASPATYSAGAWSASSASCLQTYPALVDLYYYAGLDMLPPNLEDAIIRLAHSRMPYTPCGCDVTRRIWERDRNTPEVLSAERLNCPFGISDGAWQSWQIVQREKIYRDGVL